MARTKKQSEPDESPGAPEWMVTFSDCMTLLLTFFVLLLTFSSFDKEVFQRLNTTFAEFPSVSLLSREAKDAFTIIKPILPDSEINEGSEKPTLEKGKQDQLMQETQSVDFYKRKVFLISSEKVFWGKGTAISRQGREVLATMALFLKEVPSRVVISENGSADENNTQLGLPRAWEVTKFFVKKQGLDKDRFSISEASTLRESGDEQPAMTDGERALEIVLLEPSIYK